MNVIGDTMKEEMRDVGVNKEEYRPEIEERKKVKKRVDKMISNGISLNIYDRRRDNGEIMTRDE